MKLEFVDKFGRETILYVQSPSEPVLVDERGREVIDFQDLFPQNRELPKRGDSKPKRILDAFVQRPSSGVSIWWFDNEYSYEATFPSWQEAMLIMTGKLLIRVSK